LIHVCRQNYCGRRSKPSTITTCLVNLIFSFRRGHHQNSGHCRNLHPVIMPGGEQDFCVLGAPKTGLAKRGDFQNTRRIFFIQKSAMGSITNHLQLIIVFIDRTAAISRPIHDHGLVITHTLERILNFLRNVQRGIEQREMFHHFIMPDKKQKNSWLTSFTLYGPTTYYFNVKVKNDFRDCSKSYRSIGLKYCSIYHLDL